MPRVVELAEKPLLRTAPAPLLRLSGAVHDAGLKVVLTGEGADELFGGYDIFREDKVRRFWARDPDVAAAAAAASRRLNRFLAADPARAGAFLARFYGRDLLDRRRPALQPPPPLREHGALPAAPRPGARWRARAERATRPARLPARSCPTRFARFSPLARAQYLEIATFLEGYLLHAQGDRMLMGHSIEGRFPFLDYRVAEFAARLPDSLRLRGLQEKYALRRAVARYLPRRSSAGARRFPIARRSATSSSAATRPEYVGDLLERERVERRRLARSAAVGASGREVRGGAGRRQRDATRWRSWAQSR